MEEEDFIPTRGSASKRKPKDFEVVSFESYKPKKKKEVQVDDKSVDDDGQHQGPELNMKRARYEILKFGISGFDAEKKEAAKIQLAIKLGAKPPKNKCQNYKKLLEEKKKEKVKQKWKTELQQIGKNSMGKSTAKGKSFDKKQKMKKKSGDILDIYGTVKASEIKKNSRRKR